MLREVYALAAVCDAQDTINIVRYHQVTGSSKSVPETALLAAFAVIKATRRHEFCFIIVLGAKCRNL